MCAGIVSSAQGCRKGNDIADMISSMSLSEKVSQLVTVQTLGTSLEKEEDLENLISLCEGGLGGIIWMDAGVGDLVEETALLNSHTKIPLLVACDAEWGLSMRCPEYPKFPKQGEIGCRKDGPALSYRMGRAIGRELHDVGVHVNYAPVVDINSNPEAMVLGPRSFGSDPETVTSCALGYMKGLSEEGILTCAKHFPGHGEAMVDSHMGLPVLELSRARLDSIELVPYRKLISEGVDMVMVGHLAVPSLDRDSIPASISHRIVTDLLRSELCFEGLIVTDALEMKGLTIGRDINEAVLDAYKAGADVLLMPVDPKGAIELIVSSFKDGTLDEDDLDARVERILRAKRKAGLFSLSTPPSRSQVAAYAREAVERDSVVIREILSGEKL